MFTYPINRKKINTWYLEQQREFHTEMCMYKLWCDTMEIVWIESTRNINPHVTAICCIQIDLSSIASLIIIYTFLGVKEAICKENSKYFALISPAYENCSGPQVQHYCHGDTTFLILSFKNCIPAKGSNSKEMYGGRWQLLGSNVRPLLRYTALDRDIDSQVLKHREFGNTQMHCLLPLVLEVVF